MILIAFATWLKLSFWVIMLPELLISRGRDLSIARFCAGLINRALVYYENFRSLSLGFEKNYEVLGSN